MHQVVFGWLIDLHAAAVKTREQLVMHWVFVEPASQDTVNPTWPIVQPSQVIWHELAAVLDGCL